jgi:hypothetical protein
MEASLSKDYNSLLNEYKQTFEKYLNSLQNSTVNLITVPNAVFLGESPLQTDSLNSANDCLQSCSSTTFCSGATFYKNNNICSLRKGPGSIISGKNNDAIVPISLYYSYQLKEMNQQLLDLNKDIMETLHQSYGSFQENSQLEQKHGLLIEQNYLYLKEDETKIEKMINEEEYLNSANENSQIMVQQNYYNFIIYFLITILLIFLFFRILFLNGSEQREGTKFYK